MVHLSRHCLLPYPPYLPITRYFHTFPYLLITRYFYTHTEPFIPSHTYTSLPSLVSPKLASMAVDITLSSHHLSSPILSPIDETMVDLVLEFCALPARLPRTPCIHRVLHPSAPSAPSTPSASSVPSTPSAPSASFEIAQDPIYQLAVYSRRHPKRNIKTPSCGTH